MRSVSRGPKRSLGSPASIAPKIVPSSALETVTPSNPGVRLYVRVRSPMAPAMTAVSKPKRSPPRAATTAPFTRYKLEVMPLSFWLTKRNLLFLSNPQYCQSLLMFVCARLHFVRVRRQLTRLLFLAASAHDQRVECDGACTE